MSSRGKGSRVGDSTSRPEDDARWKVSAETLLSGKKVVEWSELSTSEKVEQILWIILKVIGVFVVIFAFICSLALLTDAFKLIGGQGIGRAVRNNRFIQNPISASIIGMVITIILQSSSTLVGLLVAMIAGGIITVHQAIFLMMGAEMGSSFMNALVSLGQSGNRDQFRRAFAATTMNDVYNFLSYFVLLPLELLTGLIERTSELAVRPLNGTRTGEFKTLNALTDPLLQMIVQLDDDALTRAGSSNVTVDRETFVRRCIDLTTKEELVFCPYDHIFANSTWSDVAIGIVLLVVSITALILCMVGIIQLTQSLMAGRVAVLVRKLVDQQFPSPFGWLTGYVVMVVGCVIVMIIQSSGVFRSTLIPLVGVGVVTLDKLYPLILGSNVGTTFSGVLAAFSSDPAKLTQTLQIAICQMIYNLLGIVLFYPIPPLRRFPIFLSMKLGDTVAKYRWFALVYIAVIFVLMPGSLLLLSFLPNAIMISIVCVIVCALGMVGLINWMQLSCPHCLPIKLRDWNFLPRPLHSLHPYDRAMMKYSTKIPVIGKLFKDSQEPSPRTPEGDSPLPAANGDDRKLLHQLSRQTQV